MIGNNGHTRCTYAPTWVETFYITIATTCMSVYCTDLHVCTCTIVFKAMLIINATDGRVNAFIYAFGVQRKMAPLISVSIFGKSMQLPERMHNHYLGLMTPLDVLGSAQWFSTLDLASGYWQVEVSPEDREKPRL